MILRWLLCLLVLGCARATVPVATPLPQPVQAEATPAKSGFEALRDEVNASEVRDVGGEAALTEVVRSILPTPGSATPVELAFVVDRAVPEKLSRALEEALAANRAALSNPNLRVALVVFSATGPAKVELPLTTEAFDLIWALHRSPWTPDERSPGVLSRSGLEAATTLSWHAKGEGARRVVLLSDDRPRPDVLNRSTLPPPDEAKARDRLRAWFAESGAELLMLRCHLELHDGNAGRPPNGLPPRTAAGLFRRGRHVEVTSGDALVAALRDALSVEPSAVGTDVALVVNPNGDVSDALRDAGSNPLRTAGRVLDDFAHRPDHRLAVVSWSRDPSRSERTFTPSNVRPSAAFQRLFPGRAGNFPTDLCASLDRVRQLPWRKELHPTLVVVGSAPVLCLTADVPREWIEQTGASVTFLEPRIR